MGDVGADIWGWEKAYGRGSWDGEPYEDRARKLVPVWRERAARDPDTITAKVLTKCARDLAEALGAKAWVAEIDADAEACDSAPRPPSGAGT